MRREFLPYLPDLNGLAEITEDLEWALSVDDRELWMALKADPSLLLFADSFLRHARRPYDQGLAAASALELSVSRLALAFIHRL
jgi:hypothetical protein